MAKYGDMIGGMPLGYGEENWWTKIGQEYKPPALSYLPPAGVSPKIGDTAGPMPYGWGSPTYNQDIGKAIDPVTGKAVVPPAGTTTQFRLDDPTYPKNGDTTTPPLDPIDPIIPDPTPPLDPIIPPDPTSLADDVKYEMTPFGGRTPYQSSFDPGLFNQPVIPYNQVAYKPGVDPALLDQRNKAALEAARLGALPGLEEAMAGAGERANLAAGEGGKSGLAYEFRRKPIEAFGKQLAQTAAGLEASKSESLINENIRKNDFEMDQAQKAGDWERTQTLQKQSEKLEAQRKDAEAKAVWEMGQDVKEHDWLRGETAKIFGAEYAQALNDKEWIRNNNYDKATRAIEYAFQQGELDRQEAWRQWDAANNERLRVLNEAREDLIWQRTVAQQNNMLDKQHGYDLELKEIDKQIAKANSDAAADASMWGAIGSAAVTIGAAAIKFSDRRLKENIKRIGTNLLGIGIYEFNYLWDKIKHIGVMADEVKQVIPEAVIRHSSGFDMVNYSMLGGDINGS